MAKAGDIVRYLNDVGGGKIVRIEGNMAWVDDEGFETPVLVRECVVVRTTEEETATKAASTPHDNAKTAVAPKAAPTPTKASDTTVPADDDQPVVEVPGGDILNITLGFEPTDRHRLTESDFDASLINDSNYFLYFNLATRDADTVRWTSRYAGIVEPNTELWLGTFARLDVATFDHIRFQYIAFKRDTEYTAKEPGSVDVKVDTTKFFKLHCYRPNPYFDNEVIAFDLVDKDMPSDRKTVDLEALRNVAEPRRERRPVTKHRSERHSTSRNNEPLVVDLHINSLLDTTAGMSAADILNYQIDTFRRTMDENLRNFGRKIIFIHGKGEGVLRQALTKELNHRYRGHDVQDASFREYGYGATQVTIRQNIPKTPRR